MSDTESEQLEWALVGYLLPLTDSGLVEKEVSLEGREQNALCLQNSRRPSLLRLRTECHKQAA